MLDLRRRDFITLLGAAAAWPLAARAQQPGKLLTIGILGSGTPATQGQWYAGFVQRLRELGSRPSLLNPLWYAGAFAIGWLAGRAGDRASLGFVSETERQVEQHLTGHLEQLPAADARSRAILEQMRDDEARHGASAREAGGITLPAPVRAAMRAASRVMTTTAYRI